MLLNQTAEYALIAMTQLTSLRVGESITSSDLSDVTHIPVHYLSKIMRKMVAANLVVSQKGHNGGFSLAKSPDKIRFYDIIKASGVDVNLNQCAFGWGKCSSKKPCPLHASWSEMIHNFLSWSQKQNLGEVVPKKRMLL